jgi:hypothetical protein
MAKAGAPQLVDDGMTRGDQEGWPDQLFSWMSERGSGDLGSLGETYRWLRRRAEPSWQPRDMGAAINSYLRDLSVLGLIEVDRENRRWAAAPTAVTSLPAGEIGILAGSRTPALLDALERDDISSMVDVKELRQREAPRAILLRPRRHDALSHLAEAIGAGHVSCAARLIAKRLPHLEEEAWNEAWAPEVPTDEIACFDTSLLKFVPARSRPESGLIQFTEFGRTKFLLGNGACWRGVRRDVGIFLELSRANRKIVEWTPGNGGELRVPRNVRLPTLHERAAILCLGTLPSEEGTSLLYGNVPEDVASAISSTLWQSAWQQAAGGKARAR